MEIRDVKGLSEGIKSGKASFQDVKLFLDEIAAREQLSGLLAGIVEHGLANEPSLKDLQTHSDAKIKELGDLLAAALANTRDGAGWKRLDTLVHHLTDRPPLDDV